MARGAKAQAKGGGARGVKVRTKRTGDWEKLLKLDMAKRFKDSSRQFLFEAMQLATTVLEQRIPKQKEYESYRENLLEMALGRTGFVIVLEPPRVSMRDISQVGVVEVVPVVQIDGSRTLPARILAAHNPWTADTLPGVLAESEAKLVWKRVASLDLARAREAREKERKKVEGMLRKAGAMLGPVDEAEALEDVILQAWRLEFGLLGEPSKPHWRPMVLELKNKTNALAKRAGVKRAADGRGDNVPALQQASEQVVKEIREWQNKLA